MRPVPLVSIVITNFNYGAFVGSAVDSALAQTHDALEVIVVDDGSTDHSREILTRYSDRVILLLETNAGQAAAMNRGYQKSRGEFVLFLDADDMLEPDAIERAVAVWQEGDSKVQFALRGMDANGRQLGFRFPGAAMLSGDLRALTARTGGYPSPPTSGNLFTRSMLERVMPIPEQRWRRWPDTYLILSAAFHGQIRSIDGCLGWFRLHGNNSWVTDQVDAARLRAYLECDVAKEELTRSYIGERGTMRRSPDHLQARLASLKLDAEGHPHRQDHAAGLAVAGLTASLRHPTNSAAKRILFAGWFVAVAVLPRGLARSAIEIGYAPGRRPAWLKRILRSSVES